MTMLLCDWVTCRREVAANKWAKIRAHGQGWYFSRNGGIWCPDHRPEWATPI